MGEVDRPGCCTLEKDYCWMTDISTASQMSVTNNSLFQDYNNLDDQLHPCNDYFKLPTHGIAIILCSRRVFPAGIFTECIRETMEM